MSDHNHDKQRDATSDERVQQQRQPAPEPSLAEQVVAQFRSFWWLGGVPMTEVVGRRETDETPSGPLLGADTNAGIHRG